MLKLLEIFFNIINIVGFFLGNKKRYLSDKSKDGEDSKKVKESDSVSSLPDEIFLDGLNSLLFKKYREPSKGAFHFLRRSKEIPN